MSWFFEIVGVVCCTTWAYLLVAVIVYFAIRPWVYAIDRLQLAVCWPVAPALVMFRYLLRRRSERIERGRFSARARFRSATRR